ncbi:MAG: thrombospondin type 3 repeat-containing protein, partial [Saprospiraceae bacterium]
GLFQNVRFFDTSTDDTSLPDSITIEFYYTEYNRNTDTTDLTPGFPSPTVDLEITLNEFNFSYILLAEIPNLFATGGTPGTWEKRSVTFSTANAGITDSRTTYKLSIVYRGTNVNDYVFIDGVSARASGLVDTDGDGITDVNEPGTQNDPCLPAQAAGYTGFHAANPLWQAADCDGDGVNNGQEVIDGTDPYAPPTCGGDGPILIQN